LPPLAIEYVISETDGAKLPTSPAEVAIVGRSNVGKSSLINALAHRKHLANVSGTPGRTRQLNLFSVEPAGTLVDLPGYGYAVTSKATRAQWGRMIEQYLLNREELAMIIVLVDGEIGPTALDLDMLDWLRENRLPHQVVATKFDKVRAAKRVRRQRELATKCMLEQGDIVWVSAETGTGIDKLRGLMLLWLS
jgi:GTP-binding protein